MTPVYRHSAACRASARSTPDEVQGPNSKAWILSTLGYFTLPYKLAVTKEMILRLGVSQPWSMRGLDPVVWDGLGTLRGPWDWVLLKGARIAITSISSFQETMIPIRQGSLALPNRSFAS